MSEEKKLHYKKCGYCEKMISWEHGSCPDNCPKCNAIQWRKPRDECLLFNLQEDYLKTKDEKILGKMYLIMYQYAQKIILKQLPYKYDESKLEEKTEDAVTTIIKYYLLKPNYKILHSFGGMLFGPTRQELFKKKQQDIDNYEMSYDNFISDSDDKSTFKDKISSDILHDDDKYTRDLINIHNREYLVKELSRFINEIYRKISTFHGIEKGVLSLILLHHFLNGEKEEFFDNFYLTYGTDLKDLIEKEKLILLEYIEDLMKK